MKRILPELAAWLTVAALPGSLLAAPPPVTDLRAEASGTEILLSWTAPDDPSVAGYLIAREESAPATESPVDGWYYSVFPTSQRSMVGESVVVYVGDDASTSGFVDSGLMPGIEYHYALFTMGQIRDFSTGAHASAVPDHVPVTWTVACDQLRVGAEGDARRGFYQGALEKLENDLLAKCDGFFGGSPGDDWLTTEEAQGVVYPLILDLIIEVKLLLQELDS